MGVVDEGAAPGVEEAEHPQGSPEPLGVAGQILEGMSRGGKEAQRAWVEVEAIEQEVTVRAEGGRSLLPLLPPV